MNYDIWTQFVQCVKCFRMYALCKILRFSSRKNSQIALKMLSQTDPSQTQFFNEPLILVDELDQIQGQISKFDAHVKRDGRSPLHRAFSLFHFNSKNQLLLQQRSHLKVSFKINILISKCDLEWGLNVGQITHGAPGQSARITEKALQVFLWSKNIWYLPFRFWFSSNAMKIGNFCFRFFVFIKL